MRDTHNEQKNLTILHITNYYSKDMAYQENLLPMGQVENGHDVFLITSSVEYQFDHNLNTRKKELGITNDNGVKIIRISHLLEIKNRFVIFKKLKKQIELVNPDIIFFYDHSPSLLSCISYIKKNKHCKLNILFHSTLDNSMNSLLGKPYHKLIWKNVIRRIQKYYHLVMCNSPEAEYFALNVYKINKDKTRVLPLPGDASLLNNYEKNRKKFRNKNGFLKNDIVLIHSGKLPGKKRTELLLRTFKSLKWSNYKLIIIGSVSEEFQPLLDKYLDSDERISYVGWKTASEIREYLVSGDIMVQPGSLSNTFIDAICNGLPLILDDSKQGRFLTSYNNGILLENLTESELSNAIEKVSIEMENYRRNTIEYASVFHYKKNAELSVNMR